LAGPSLRVEDNSFVQVSDEVLAVAGEEKMVLSQKDGAPLVVFEDAVVRFHLANP
jgi:hypothetical protein